MRGLCVATMDSSSDDECVSKLESAVDPELFNNTLFQKNWAEEGTRSESSQPSLRYQEKAEYNPLNVSPEFQSYVAKYLSKLIDKDLQEEVGPTLCNGIANKLKSKRGIHLLSDSNFLLDAVDFNDEGKPLKRAKVLESSSEDSEVERDKLTSVVVSPDYILNKEGIQGWPVPTRGKVITVQSSNDTSAANSKKKKKKKKKKRKMKASTAAT